MSPNPLKWAGLALLLFTTAFVGCGEGKNTGDVVGTIKINGKAPEVLGLTITFMAADGRPVVFGVNKDGTFSAQGVPVGENKVGLTFAGDDPDEEPRGRARLEKLKAAKKSQIAKAPKASGLSIPLKLQDPQTSGKSVLVEPGKENKMTWDLKM